MKNNYTQYLHLTLYMLIYVYILESEVDNVTINIKLKMIISDHVVSTYVSTFYQIL